MTAPAGQITYEQQPPEEMTYEDYLAAVAAVTAALAATVLAISIPFQAIRLTRLDWLSFLAATYPYVDSARTEVSDLSRRFYDSERGKHVPPLELPIFDVIGEIFGPDGRPVRFEDNSNITGTFYERLNINLAPYDPDWYEEAMDAVVDLLVKPDTSDGEVVQVITQAMKEAENGGRRTMLYAIPDDDVVKGWARVQGGEDSCAFCAMLISRGPVYVRDPRNAGLDVDDEALAVRFYNQGLATGEGIPEELMTKWHPNCDCKVVPVFDYMRWPGRSEYLALSELWGDVTGPYLGGKKGGDKLKAFRRYLETGSVGDDSDLQKIPGYKPRRRRAA